MVSSALDYSSKIISHGDYNIDFLGNLPTEIADIINLYGLEIKYRKGIRPQFETYILYLIKCYLPSILFQTTLLPFRLLVGRFLELY
jgi:hypothetical protein